MIKSYINPPKKQWEQLAKRASLQQEDLTLAVTSIFEAVQTKGDLALKEYTQRFDKVCLDSLVVPLDRILNASVAPQLFDAMKLAANNIRLFHESQKLAENRVETTAGVSCWQKEVPIEKVGLYIPGGTAPLFSTVLMLAIPAKLAGCREIVVCTPPQADGQIDPAILVACKIAGIKSIYAVGGAQAIAAMTFGTASIPKVYKILGPGNQYVTRAKELATHYGIAIDMPAGPSELLVIADTSCNPNYVAADLLSQAEHGPDSQVVLLSDNAQTIAAVNVALNKQLTTLSRASVAAKALEHSFSIRFDTINDCIQWSNYYAPEHLILAVNNAQTVVDSISNAGSVFIGNYSPESAGDYATGTNHTLPTSGYAKNYSGVNLSSFTKKISFQQLSAQGLIAIGPSIEIMATAEGLDAHKNAISIRLKDLANV